MRTELLGKYVTARTSGPEERVVQGAVIGFWPTRIRQMDGGELNVLSDCVEVSNPPRQCIGCDLPLGGFCARCRKIGEDFTKALEEAKLDHFEISCGDKKP